MLTYDPCGVAPAHPSGDHLDNLAATRARAELRRLGLHADVALEIGFASYLEADRAYRAAHPQDESAR